MSVATGILLGILAFFIIKVLYDLADVCSTGLSTIPHTRLVTLVLIAVLAWWGYGLL
jgi:hypothetical protein